MAEYILKTKYFTGRLVDGIANSTWSRMIGTNVQSRAAASRTLQLKGK